MSWNRFYKSAPVEFKFEETPLQPLMMALQSRQKRFDVSRETSDEIYDTSIDSLQADRKLADEKVGG